MINNGKCIKFTIVIILLFFVSTGLYAQKLPFRNYGIEHGLPHTSIFTIVQDTKGFMWIGSQGGLSRFDGKTFTNFFVDDTEGKNWIWTSYLDSEGILWFGSNGGGLIRFDGQNWQTITDKDGLIDNSIRALIEDRNHVLWVGTRQGISRRIDGIWKPLTAKDGLCDNLVHGFFEDDDGSMWVCTDGGITIFNGGTARKITKDDGLVHNNVWSIFKDKKGDYWVATARGVSIYNGTSWKNLTSKQIGSRRIRQIVECGNGCYYFAARQGLIKYEGGKFELLNESKGLVGNALSVIFTDNEANIWIGTRGGISVLPLHLSTVSYSVDDGLLSNLVTSIIEDRTGAIWFGTGAGINRLKDGAWTSFFGNDKLADGHIRALFEDSKGNIFAGMSGGFSIYNGKTWRKIRLELPLTNVIQAFAEDRAGNIWICTRGGIVKWDRHKFTYYTKEDGLTANVTRDVAIDESGTVWVATRRGVNYFAGGEWKSFTRSDGLVGNDVNTLFLSDDNEIWVGTRSGLSVIHTGIIKNYRVAEGLSGNQIMFVNRKGNDIYIGTSTGVNRFNGETFRLYSMKDGFISAVAVRNSSLVDSRGNVWFGTSKGVVHFNPDHEPVESKIPVYITDVYLFNEKVSLMNDPEFTHYQNYLGFNFIGLNFRSPKGITYKYKLTGADQDWRSTDQTFIQYAALAPGDYTFTVFAVNEEGKTCSTPAELSFVIHPPFWETLWFRSFVFIVIIGLIVLQMNRLKKRNIELEDKVKKRTEELEKSADKIETLEGLLPICCQCKRIRKDNATGENMEDWIEIEAYLKKSTAAEFTHGICPECRSKLYPEID